MSKQECKVFIGGLSWETSNDKLRAYFENYGVVREAFVSYNRNNGRPRGFGFVVFESPEVADKVVATKHTIDRREVEAKKAVPKEEQFSGSQPSNETSSKTKKIFVGGLAPAVDEKLLRQYFEQFGQVEDAVVMYDHDNKRPRGFGFVSFAEEESVDKVFGQGVMQTILDKQIEIKPAVPRDQMPNAQRMLGNFHDQQQQQQFAAPRAGTYGYGIPQYGNVRQFRPPGPRSPYVPGLQGAPMMPGPRGPRQFAGPQGPVGFVPQGANSLGPRYPGYQAKAPMQGGYDLYGAGAGLPNGAQASVYGTNSQALYNLAAGFQPHINGLQGGPANKLNTFSAASNIANLKALGALASNFAAAFPTSQAEAFQDDPSNFTGQEGADFTADAVNLNSAAGLASVAADYNTFHDAGFTSSPAPGWSS